MREKQHGGRQNTPVLVTFRITRPAAPDVLSQPSPARNIFHSPGNITSQWTQLLCTAHYTPPGAALKPEVLDVMWSNFRKRIYHCLYWVESPSTSCHKTNEEIFNSKSIAVGGLVNYHKYEAQETSGIIREGRVYPQREMCCSLRKWSQEMVRHQEASRRSCVLQELQSWSLLWQEVLNNFLFYFILDFVSNKQPWINTH